MRQRTRLTPLFGTLSLASLLGLSGITLGCEKGPAEKAGERIDDAADDVEDAVEDAGDEIEDATDR